MGDADTETNGDDVLIAWFVERISSSFRAKVEKINIQLGAEEARGQVLSFIHDADARRLLVTDSSGKGDVKLYTDSVPTKFKKKTTYFIKVRPSALTVENIGSEVLFGDFGESPLEHLSLVSQEVFVPLMCNPANQEGWPEVISREVTENMHKFVANLYVTIGLTKGKTLLPLPPKDVSLPGGRGERDGDSKESTSGSSAAAKTRDKDLIHNLESAVVTWTRQIKQVLKMDPEQLLKDGSNPGPLVELEFWENKAANLNSIHEQLSGENIKKVSRALEMTKSTYFPAFNRLCREVASAKLEANDNLAYLRPLKKLFERLSLMDDFNALSDLFLPIMHNIMLVWKHSTYYNTSVRIVVLMRQICNDLIMQACKYVDGSEILQVEPQEAVDKLKATLKICGTFKSFYFDYKAKTTTETPENPWRFQNSALFVRLDSFLERCHDILDLTQTILQFDRLEKVEVGGTKGKILTTTVRQIYADFLNAVKKFQSVNYDIMDVESKQFDDDFYEFRCVIKELERRLGSIIVQAFDDCTTLTATFKLLDSFDGMLEREIIASDLEKKHVALINSFAEEIKDVQRIFSRLSDKPHINKNSPQRAGAVLWVRGLIERIKGPMEKLRAFSRIDSDEGKELVQVYDRLMQSLTSYETATVEMCSQEMEATSEEKLKQNLIKRVPVTEEAPLPLLEVNFDPLVVRLLRETRYMLLLGIDVPASSMKIYGRREVFRQQIGKLGLIVSMYNNILSTLLPVEKPLIEKKIGAVDTTLQKGLSVLSWNSHRIDDYIQEVLGQIRELDEVLSTIKGNVSKTKEILKRWEANPLFDRKDGKVYSVGDFSEAHKALTSLRAVEIGEGGAEIQKLLSRSSKALKVSKGSKEWKAYVEYVNDIVIEGFISTILGSVKVLRNQVDPVVLADTEAAPLLEIGLELVAPEVVWVPEISSSIRETYYGWIKDFFSIGASMKRLDVGDGDYTEELEQDERVKEAVSQVTTIILENETKCRAFKESYDRFEYLWKRDIQGTLKEFLETEGETLADGTHDDPPLEKFDAEISNYKDVQQEIQNLKVSESIGWLKIDSKPIKQALSTWVTKWIFLYTNYLSNKLNNNLDELDTFIDDCESTFDNEPTEDNLYEIMNCMRNIRKRMSRTDAMFGPLTQTTALLRRYGIEIPDERMKQLENAPHRWEQLKKHMNTTRENVSTIQVMEGQKIREASDTFAEKVEKFREHFLELAPLDVKNQHLRVDDIGRAYALLDHFRDGDVDKEFIYGSVSNILEESRKLNESQELFEIHVVDYVALRRCDEEIDLLRTLWNLVSDVLTTFQDWDKTPWEKINVEFLIEETKKIMKKMQNKDTLPGKARTFQAFAKLDAKVKALLTSLPLVEELHHPSMRERHWKQLMRATGKQFVVDEKFSLGDLLGLELHKYVDSVSEIVERAQKELLIEKQLKKFEETWASLNVEFNMYMDTDIPQISIDDLVTETLETDTLVLQNLVASKFVQGNDRFLEIVGQWQHKLGTVDQCLQTWLDTQKKWQALEAIFVGSADIRVQLPEDSKKFDGVNADFQGLMKEAPETLNVVDACNLDGRLERIEGMLLVLEACEKSLQDYLETKRVAFPRFYFVAAADLLDILSKGSDPQKILRHLSKNFDSLSDLEFTKDDKGVPTKNAIGMYSKEREYVRFDGECSCDGQVESWLQNVVNAMRGGLRKEFVTAMLTYDAHSRTDWLFMQSAQITVVVSRVFYTQEMNETFEQLEDGNESALKEAYQKQVDNISGLIKLINTDLKKNDRKKIVTLCMIDVHARDVAERLMKDKVESSNCFQWQSQLKYAQNMKTKDPLITICDAEINYGFEYIGNCGCLVITPLTDRCYITLTQAQRLVLGGAPAGPAGTGKTETVKDLSRALGFQVLVFNCSDQMDYKSMASMYKGLAQTGAWGCFDEFNRIPVSVLSVCSTQYKTVLDAIRAQKDNFIFDDVEITLTRTVMAFITMNPGYPGRAELPESLKALFRPVSMVVPDLMIICEIMLMAEGFSAAKLLARKFVILYKLCEDLLSKSAHYDWKLRAIKTTLYVAGGMKRDQPELSEDKVLLQALRDFNLGKLTKDDTSIFMGLLNDLFPKTLDLVPRRVDDNFEKQIKKSATTLGYQPEDVFTLKITQLREIFEVRWSVFLLGPAGCGKTSIWKTLQHAQNAYGEKSIAKMINPKAVLRNELYGYLHPSTREWKEGLISVTFREMANNTTNEHQWIVLDGDIDAEWIESMNTVMDDNKMLTLASNERIPLTSSMRLLLEINHMNHCSPATVSRGGVIYVNEGDVGWHPVAESWTQSLENKEYAPILMEFFEKYVERSLEHVRRNFKTIIPISSVNIVSTICKILAGVIPSEVIRGAPPPDKKLVEFHFVYACVWAMGGCMLVDKVSDYKTEFSKWWKSEWKTVRFPDAGLVFDYRVDEKSVIMAPWSDSVPEFIGASQDFTSDFGNLFVPTLDTTIMDSFLDSLIPNNYYVMLVGNAGTGKTAILRNKLKSLDTETWQFSTINMHNFMDASALQVILEQPLEKKSGTRYGPVGSRRLIYFLDDLNMPFVDKYDTQTPIELLRQSIDYRGWFDKVKIQQKEINNTQYVACMNPTAGSFNVTPRMQRHFASFGVQMPVADVIKSIFSGIIESHMANFDPDVSKLAPKLVNASVELHNTVMNNFLPSAVKFHYQFNLRDLSNISQGICRMQRDSYSNTTKVVRLWIHECERVFLDRLTNDIDVKKFNDIRQTVTKKYFEESDMEAVEARPIVYSSFMQGGGSDEPSYEPGTSYEKLRKIVEEKLQEYNDSNPVMNLVLFNQALEHVCRICRIIDLPRGNAMLVGVGGSGKQSLARLASFICGYDVFQISVTSSYGVNEFKEDLMKLYQRAGLKGHPVAFLMTDGQIVKEEFLVYLNDLLSSGYIPDLFSPEDKDNVCNSVRSEVKQAGVIDSAENCWDFFIEKVRKYLHVVLCFSPVGDKFRVRARNFPALINGTVIDWFHAWPHEALVSVAGRFLEDVTGMSDDVRENMQYHMAFAHTSVNEMSESYIQTERRYCYTTPKSFLELISLYKTLLARERESLRVQRERLESGVEKIKQASEQVTDLQTNLKQEQIIVEEKKATADKLIVQIGQEKAKVEVEKDSSRDDEEACAKKKEEVEAFQEECESDLKAAEPIIQEAEAALNSLDKKSLGELKSFGSPASEIVQVAAACIVLTAPGGKIPKDLTWNAGKKMMQNVDAFLRGLLNFDKDNVPEVCVERVEKDYISNPNFNAEYIKTKSGAAAGLCGWVVNICKYFRIYQIVAPKRAKLAAANAELESANKKLAGIRAKVKELEDRVENLEETLMKATEDKNNAIAQAEKTQRKADLADRLVNGLAGENKRWGESIAEFGVKEESLIGDILVAAAFVSYAGPFNATYRKRLIEEFWIPDVVQREIPMTEGIHPLDLLTDDAKKAGWANEGLPTDPLSVENGAIITNASRWSLMIDPQLQGIKWIRRREEEAGIKVIQLSQPRYIDTVEQCVENGIPLLIESLGVDIDAVLDPLIARQTIKKGRNVYIKLGDKEVEYDPNFRLYLHTKLSNPHYKPEVNAQTTLVNFCVTEKGLEDQLLALVVGKERPDLQEEASNLVKQLSEFTITLKQLEDSLLEKLSNSKGDILEDIELIENLEETKRTASDIAEKVILAKETEANINANRELYRPVAAIGALMYFWLDNLNVLDRVYQYSMANFVYVLSKAIDTTPGGPDESKVPESERLGTQVEVAKRVELLTGASTKMIFSYITNGMFERHKVIAATQLTMMVLRSRGELKGEYFDWLLRCPKVVDAENPLKEFLLDSAWAAVQSLKEFDDYAHIADDMVGSAKRWKEWSELERPELEPLPGDFKKLPDFEQLLIVRALRPDRMTNAMINFVSKIMGAHFVTSQPFNLKASFEDSSPGVPIFVFLSPGVDVAAAVEAVGKPLGFTYEAETYASVSLGQGQEPIAMKKLAHMRKNGGWVLLQNIHLTIDWTCGILNEIVDKLAEGSHENFRLFLSAEPPPSLERGLPISLLQNSIKLTNEPPEGMVPNLKRAWLNFSEDMFENCSKPSEMKSISFALCYFHAAMLERKKFGVGNLPGASSGIGWNMNYPFNTGDLLCCAQTANNYLENNSNVPWEDLRYIFGEILYGGHIVEDWDRRLAQSYLLAYMKEELIEPGIELCPDFMPPANTLHHTAVVEHIGSKFPAESPMAFGLHPNAEIGFRLRDCESLCASVLSLQAQDASSSIGITTEEKAKSVLDDIIERLPEFFDLDEIREKSASSDSEVISPYAMVVIQEAERMNKLLAEVRRSLKELDLGLKGDLTMSDPMEQVMAALANDKVPKGWERLAYPSLRGLGSWLSNLLARVTQLQEWSSEMSLPNSVWLSGLFNPQSFLTAVMQTTARRNEWPLDKTVIITEVTKKTAEQLDAPSRDGAFVHGLTLEGCRLDEKTLVLDESRPKELFYQMPVILIKAVTVDKADVKESYKCPVYKTERRFREEVFTAQLKSKHGEIKWTLAGVCMFLDVVDV